MIDKNRTTDARNIGDLEFNGWVGCIARECKTADPKTLIWRPVRFLDGNGS